MPEHRPAFPFPVAAEVPLYLAPMAGVSESPFRRLCRAHGADVVVTEFLSAEGIRRENEATISKLRFGPDERPIGVQIFGAEHFNRTVNEWSCSAAPVHDPTSGQVLGAIDITGGHRVAARLLDAPEED